MQVNFHVSTAVLTNPETRAFFPRAVRKTLRLNPARTYRAEPSVHTTLTSHLLTEYRTDADSDYFSQNLHTIDPEPLADEFGDMDDEFAGLTITDAMDEVELFEFCTGYNVI